jgi:ribose/xylose/arabinose/galactoside ABC-type transport system permease subunit
VVLLLFSAGSQLGFLLPWSSKEQDGDSLCSGGVGWWCVSEMRQHREVGVVCGLINGVVVVYGGLGPF